MKDVDLAALKERLNDLLSFSKSEIRSMTSEQRKYYALEIKELKRKLNDYSRKSAKRS